MADQPVVAFIGFGAMGTPMVGRLTDAGFSVHGYDVADSARERGRVVGATMFDLASDAVGGADVVILMLPDSDVVDAVVTDLLATSALGAETVVVDMSSSQPLRTRALAKRLDEHGVYMLDAPVSVGVAGTGAGALTIMVGGDEGVLERVRTVLNVLGRVVYAGAIGSGHAVKALNNLLSATHLLSTSEAIVAGESFGLDPAVMLSIFNGSSGRSGSTENKWPNFILTETFDSGFALRLMVKDMRIAVDLAEQGGVPIELGQEAAAIWERAAVDLPVDADHTEIARWLQAREAES